MLCEVDILGMENKNIIIATAVLLIMLFGIGWFWKPSTGIKQSASAGSNFTGSITTDETSFDFGTISMAAGNVSHTFKIKNSGTEPAMITTLYTSCMCTSAYLTKAGTKFGPFGMAGHGLIPKINQVLAAGEEATVEVVFDPAAHGPAGVGPIERVVYVETGSGAPMEFMFRTVVTP